MRTGESETESHQLVPVGVLGSTFLVHAWTLRENTHPHCRDLARKINILWGGRCLRVRGTGNGLSASPVTLRQTSAPLDCPERVVCESRDSRNTEDHILIDTIRIGVGLNFLSILV